MLKLVTDFSNVYKVAREHVQWQIAAKKNKLPNSNIQTKSVPTETCYISSSEFTPPEIFPSPSPSGQKIPLYKVAHSRVGDKGNDMNFSIIPHFPPDVDRLKLIITPEWVKQVLTPLMNPSSFSGPTDIEKRHKWVDEHVKVEIYEAPGIHSLNVVVRNILDGGVNCSRRIDRHGKTISDVILCQQVVLPPLSLGLG